MINMCFRETKTYVAYEIFVIARQTIHVKCQAIFSLKKIKKVISGSCVVVSFRYSHFNFHISQEV